MGGGGVSGSGSKFNCAARVYIYTLTVHFIRYTC